MYSLRLVKIICDALASLPTSIWLETGESLLAFLLSRSQRLKKIHHSRIDYRLYFVQVKDAVQAIDPHLVAMACGSYRRGKATCGDVDILISHPDGKSHKGVFSKVLQSLHDSGKLHLLIGVEDFLMSYS